MKNIVFTLITLLSNLMLFVLASQPAAIAQEHTEEAHYVYAFQLSSGEVVLKTINPSSPNDDNELYTVPMPQGTKLHKAVPSPNGAWIVLIPTTGVNPTEYIRLVNVQTGETKDIVANLGFANSPSVEVLGPEQRIVWSPNSQYLAFNSIENGQSDTFIYRIEDSQRINLTLDEAIQSELEWSADSTRLAISGEHCPPGPCDVTIEVFDTIAQTREVSLTVRPGGSPIFGAALCQLRWSPDSRFISFASTCSRTINGSIKELYVLDRMTSSLTEITNYTVAGIQPEDSPMPYDIRWGTYETMWLDSQTLLFGVTFAEGSTDNLKSQTIQYNVLDGSSMVLQATEMARGWSLNPLTNQLAFRNTTGYFDAVDLTVQIASLNNNELSTTFIGPAGCDLSWSLDGTILAYTYRGEAPVDCYSPVVGLMFVNVSTGQIMQRSFPAEDRIKQVGWVALAAPKLPPTADAGPDQIVTATGDTALVTLDGSGSTDPDGTITSYSWSEADTVIATEEISQVELPVGSHDITLTVTDNEGATGSDDVTIVVEPPSYPFFEDFESGTDKWALTGHWAASSSQFYSGTWSVRNARGTDYTAYTDTLTLNDPIDIPADSTPYFTYWSRYKLSTNERVQMQVSTDDGASWTTIETYFEITDLNWKPRRIDLRSYQGQSIRLRFVFVATACTSDCIANTFWWIDDVRVYEFPADALNEDFEAGTSRWALTQRWARASTQHHSGSWSVRSTRATDYTAFTDTLTLNAPLNLTDFAAPLLTYWTRYQLTSYETVQIQVYVGDSGPWTTIQTISNLTNLEWMRQRVDLSPYSGQSIQLRFVFTATACPTGCVANRMWWIDDVSIIEQPAMTFADDFELGLTDWTVSTRWVRSDIQHHSGIWSVIYNRGTDYTAHTELLSLNVPLVLTTSDIPVLTFWTRYRLSSYELAEVQVRSEGAPDWTTLWTRTDEINTYWPELIWWRQQLDLSPYIGQSLELRFRFRANACISGCVEERRWWLDDVQIAELPPPSGDLPFVDDIEGTTSNWTMTGGWSYANEVSDPNNTFLDSMIRTSTYQNPETLRLIESLDLTGVRQPKLRFRTKYWFLGYPAYGAVQVSADGGTHWEELEKIESETIASWQNKEIDLSAYAGRSIQLRFRLYSTIPSASNAIWDIDDVIIQETAP